VLDLGWLRGEVADLYADGIGRPGIDPEAALRLMLAGFLLGIVHDRRLMREAQVNLAIRWFAGFGLHDRLPDHSSLTRIRQRWGADRFRRIFERTVLACVEAKIATGEVVHVDASLIRADVAWESLAVRHVERVAEANGSSETPPDDREPPLGGGSGSTLRVEHGKAPPDGSADRSSRNSKKKARFKKVCTTDPDATMATSGRNRRLEPSYKQHAVVDDARGVVLDVAVTTGEANEGNHLLDGLDRAAELTGSTAGVVTADAGYAYAKVFAGLEDRMIDAVIPAKAEQRPGKVIPTRRFKLDPRHNIVRCPRGRVLRPKGKPSKGFQYYHARAKDCGPCPLRARCVSPSRHARVVVFNLDHPSLLRARRRRLRWSEEDDRLYRRHRWRSEGYHGEAKTWHGLARAVRRGIDNMRIQAFLTAAAVNLKRLAAALLALLCSLLGARTGPRAI
jgi:transposase